MTTKWADGFEDTAAADLAADYTIIGSATITTGRRAGTNAVAMGGSTSHVNRQIGGTASTMFCSSAFVMPSWPGSLSAGRALYRFMEGSIIHVSVYVGTNGTLNVYRGDLTTLLGSSATFVVPTSWTWAQIKVVISDTVGSVEIRDSGGAVLVSVSGVDTRNAGTGYCDAVSVGAGGVASTAHDDWHIWDGAGTVCNTFTNDTRIDHKNPTGAGTYAQFTPSAGANHTCVDELTFNTTDYVESATAGQKDAYAFGDISHAPPNIFSVLVTAVGTKDDAGARSIKPLVRQGGADYAGTATTLNQGAYVRAVDIREVDPSTGAAWTQTGFNAAEFGFENV